jgi:SAM-dependent methyltransferase
MSAARFAYHKVIASRIAGRRVLDVGCASIVESDRFLAHNCYADTAREIYGIDILADALTGHGSERHFVLDITDVHGCLQFVAAHGEFEDVIATEVFEHLDNPGLALDSIDALLLEGGILHVTTPNALCPAWINKKLSREARGPQHKDHVLWHCGSSIENLLTRRGGWTILSVEYYFNPNDKAIAQKLRLAWHNWMGRNVYVRAQKTTTERTCR